MARWKPKLVLTGMVAVAAVIAGVALLQNSTDDHDTATIEATANSDSSQHTEAKNPESTTRDDVNQYPLNAELTTCFRMILQSNFNQARRCLEPILVKDPDSPQAIFLYGLSYHKAKEYSTAQPHFQKVLSLAPDYHQAHYFLGWCEYWNGNLSAARSAFETHLRMKPDEGDSHFGLGLIELDEGNLTEAEHQFQKSIDLQKDDPRRGSEVAKGHLRLGDVAMQREDWQRARQELVIAARILESIGRQLSADEVYYKLYQVLTQLGDENAKQMLQLYEQITDIKNRQRDEALNSK